ncbi:MAG TPA: c-type cytochrome biogenesis protein CcsB [Nitriliruptorales bacterium]|nr:c-type cytochrome biogenesis protein CcsB [Nitriliruptorales bacterium]
MSLTQLEALSRTLFFPWAFLLYAGAMVAYFYRMAFTGGDRRDGGGRVARAVGVLGVVLLAAGLATHVASLVARSLASGGRVPLGNMYEYSSVMGAGVALIALLVVHARMRRPELVGFVLMGGLLMMASAQVLYTPAGPLMPALQTHWLKIHTNAMMISSTILIVAFVLTGLFLIRDLAEQRVAILQAARYQGSTVGAAYVPPALDDAAEVQRPEGYEDDGGLPAGPGRGGAEEPGAYGAALRQAVNPLPLVLGAAAIAFAYSLLFRNPVATVVAPVVVGLGTLLAWWFLASLPSAATLDSLAYRTTAFAFPILTFGVIAGAIWAEQSWGRYWGWDPKETGAFLTWVAYAGYLHARATRGLRGRGAAGIGVVAFLLLMFTYYAVNLWIAGLHSYQGTGIAAESNPPWAGIAGALLIYGGTKLVTRRWSPAAEA